MIIEDIVPYTGQHCETTATGTLLKQIGINLSEPMLFGLGEGLGFVFWKMKTMDFPFIGGRVKTDLLTENLCRNLNLDLKIQETASILKAWDNIKSQLDRGRAVGLKLDCYHLDYFTKKIHFAGHYVAMYGYDDQFAYLVDTEQQGKMVKTTLKNLELARNEKGPMSSRNRSYIINKKERLPDLKKVIPKAIKKNAQEFLNPPIKNLGYKGITKTGAEIKKWFEESKDIRSEFQTSATLMERAGTGGSLFRNLYRDFLMESAQILDCDKLMDAHLNYSKIAEQWKMISDLFFKIGETKKKEYVYMASDILEEIAHNEKAVMEKLDDVFA
ncbi:MAG: BtrH N-terminal domain-containing protein [Cyclobacteriaceae bacterium]|nr:BtrH N-terminal domain-containing protein [Cyclobacteriaceae bacterium]